MSAASPDKQENVNGGLVNRMFGAVSSTVKYGTGVIDVVHKKTNGFTSRALSFGQYCWNEPQLPIFEPKLKTDSYIFSVEPRRRRCEANKFLLTISKCRSSAAQKCLEFNLLKMPNWNIISVCWKFPYMEYLTYRRLLFIYLYNTFLSRPSMFDVELLCSSIK